MSRQTVIDTLKASEAGLLSFEQDAANPDIVAHARLVAEGKQPGNVQGRGLHYNNTFGQRL